MKKADICDKGKIYGNLKIIYADNFLLYNVEQPYKIYATICYADKHCITLHLCMVNINKSTSSSSQ